MLLLNVPKYTMMEFERRWLVGREALGSIQIHREQTITDKYLLGTRMRLRRVETSSGDVSYKLCKKYGKISRFAEPIVNTYLSEAEFELLNQLPGASITKFRKYVADGAIDVFGRRSDTLAIFEVEFESEAAAECYVPPRFVLEEVTDVHRFSGAVLAIEGSAY